MPTLDDVRSKQEKIPISRPQSSKGNAAYNLEFSDAYGIECPRGDRRWRCSSLTRGVPGLKLCLKTRARIERRMEETMKILLIAALACLGVTTSADAQVVTKYSGIQPIEHPSSYAEKYFGEE